MDEERIILMLMEMRADMKDIRTDIKDIKTEQTIMRSAITNIEQTHSPLIKAMIDAQVSYEEKHYTHEPRIIKLENITEQHEIKISHLLHQA